MGTWGRDKGEEGRQPEMVCCGTCSHGGPLKCSALSGLWDGCKAQGSDGSQLSGEGGGVFLYAPAPQGSWLMAAFLSTSGLPPGGSTTFRAGTGGRALSTEVQILAVWNQL